MATQKARRLPRTANRYGAVEVPFTIRIALPSPPSPLNDFQPANIVQVLRHVLGTPHLNVYNTVFNVTIWAPSWSDDDLNNLLNRPFAAPKQYQTRPALRNDPLLWNRVETLLPHRQDAPMGTALEQPNVDILYFAGVPSTTPADTAKARKEDLPSGVDDFAAELTGAKTRLLIVHDELPRYDASRKLINLLFRQLIERGLPAALSVWSNDAESADRYFLKLFKSIAHNEPLMEATRPLVRSTVRAELLPRSRRSGPLALTPARRQLESDIRSSKQATRHFRRALIAFSPALHKRRHAHLVSTLNDISSRLDTASEKVSRIEWSQERKGLVPLTDTRNTLRSLPLMRSTVPTLAAPGLIDWSEIRARSGIRQNVVRDLWQPLAEEVVRAPRVLNAIVRKGNKVVAASESLRRNVQYQLAVQIGPRIESPGNLVTGADQFPESALYDGTDGHVLDVILLSEDIEPRTIQQQIWLPRCGPSSPIVGGKRSRLGFAFLPFRIGDVNAKTSQIEGRLCIFYRNTLLQSATAKLAVQDHAQANHAESNEIRVDYAVTGSFAEVGRFETRRLTPSDRGPQERPVALAIVQNRSETGHRFIVKGSTLPAQWRQYDPVGNAAVLSSARDTILQRLKLGTQKSFRDFRDDLRVLAASGRVLYDKAFSQSSQSTEPSFIDYLRKLKSALRSRAVIQIATSGLTQYVYPWALVYDYRLRDPDHADYCEVLARGAFPWADGPSERCPFDSKHTDNILCPYGFWGLRHVIEQPLSALPPGQTDVEQWGEPRASASTDALQFSAVVTRDVRIAQLVKDHLTELGALGSVVPLDGSDSWQQVQQELQDATLLYFLCHGKRDDTKAESYLGIGKLGNVASERIYPSDLTDWAVDKTDTIPALKNAPFVFINGCQTAGLTSDDLVNFVQSFAGLGASGVMGTEVSVPVDFATSFALALFDKIKAANPEIGQALYETRWDFALNGNLFGLIYTPYCFATLKALRSQP